LLLDPLILVGLILHLIVVYYLIRFGILAEIVGLHKIRIKLKENPNIIYEDGSLSQRNDLQSPTHVRSRGRPKKRLGANTDKK
ncbi:hypothetical protein PIB30_111857, partial [Stylosanthes scabra]|nr:hypothetical protein [Stylosanthes scabra]